MSKIIEVSTKTLLKARGTANLDYRSDAQTSRNVAALADDIRKHGIKQALRVRPVGDMFEVLDGMQRWTAAEIVGLTTVPVRIEHLTDEQVFHSSRRDNIVVEDE